MKAKQYLQEIQTLKTRRDLAIRIWKNSSMEGGLHGVDYARPRVQATRTNRIESAAWDMIESRQKAQAEACMITAEINKRLNMIGSLSRPEYVSVLLKKYVDGKTAKEIAADMRRGVGTVENYILAATKEFSRKFESVLSRDS